MTPSMSHAGMLSACSAVLLAVPLAAAPRLDVGTVRGSPKAVVAVPVYFTPGGAAVAGLQLELAFDTARLDAGPPTPGAAMLDHVIAHSEPSLGTSRAIVYSLSKAAFAAGELASVQFTIQAGAPFGSTGVSLQNVLFSSASGTKIDGAGLGDGAVQVVAAPSLGQALNIDGIVSDGKADRTTLHLTDLRSVSLTYRLSAPTSGSCQVKLRLRNPAGSLLGPLILDTTTRDITINGLEGDWLFQLNGTGGCVGQSFHLEIRPFSSAVALGFTTLALSAFGFGAVCTWRLRALDRTAS